MTVFIAFFIAIFLIGIMLSLERVHGRTSIAACKAVSLCRDLVGHYSVQDVQEGICLFDSQYGEYIPAKLICNLFVVFYNLNNSVLQIRQFYCPFSSRLSVLRIQLKVLILLV